MKIVRKTGLFVADFRGNNDRSIDRCFSQALCIFTRTCSRIDLLVPVHAAAQNLRLSYFTGRNAINRLTDVPLFAGQKQGKRAAAANHAVNLNPSVMEVDDALRNT